MKNAFLFITQKEVIEEIKFEQLESENISYCYFLANQKYYLFLFSKNPIQKNPIIKNFEVIDEIDSLQRQIRSLRGLILYTLKLMEGDHQILADNMEPFFWKNVDRVIRQNKKNGLQQFLFSDSEESLIHLQNQLDYLKSENAKLKSQLSQLNETKNSKDSGFRSLAQIPDPEKIEIIKKAFEFESEGEISLRDFYEGDDELSLSQWKGYQIKFQNIKRSKIYKSFRK
jgi:hypothetical protein